MEAPRRTLGSYLHVARLTTPAPILQAVHFEGRRCTTASTKSPLAVGLGVENTALIGCFEFI